MDAEAGRVAGPGGEGAAEGGDAFPHAEQAVSAALARRGGPLVAGVVADAVVEDGDLQPLPHPYDADLGFRAGARVFLHIGQGFLDDPVRREADGGRDARAVVGVGDLDGQAGAAEGAGEFVEAVQAGGGFGGCLGVAGLAQQSDGGAEFVERGAAGLADVGEGLLGLVGPLVHDVGGDTGLHIDEGDVVGDDVVQVAGDAQTFLGDAAAGLLLAGAFGALGAFADGLDDGAAAADGVPRGGADAGPGEDGEVLLRVPGQRPGEHRGAGQHGRGEQSDPPGGGAVGGGGDREQGDHGGHRDGYAGGRR
ncbi:hypothetical protein GCM10020256_56700 [Streptomyces thermocoprophilus]